MASDLDPLTDIEGHGMFAPYVHRLSPNSLKTSMDARIEHSLDRASVQLTMIQHLAGESDPDRKGELADIIDYYMDNLVRAVENIPIDRSESFRFIDPTPP
jgi:hypothetical protein